MVCDREVIDVEDMEVCDDTNGEVMQPSATSQLDTAYNMLLVSSGLCHNFKRYTPQHLK